ncbi:hypothetical protein Hanom_Chr10g00886541 [Helianthus anomalus]
MLAFLPSNIHIHTLLKLTSPLSKPVKLPFYPCHERPLQTKHPCSTKHGFTHSLIKCTKDSCQ